ncbi:AAA family ATPase [Lysinibacillus agricola]|uniref:AAA family ATPase n=1 Tax=Lysinibacillus agricola TaxID=2590012 RepID=UPI003C24998D
MLKVDGISIRGINGIFDLDIKLNPGFNFITGENGIGKTTILDCISSSFNRLSRHLRRNVSTEEGFWVIYGKTADRSFFEHFEIKELEVINENIGKNENRLLYRRRLRNAILSKELVNFSIYRNNNYGSMNALDNVQSWFYKNYFSDMHISEKKYSNFNLAKSCFEKLDPNIHFSKIEQRKLNNSPNIKADIYLETPSGEIPLNYLSSGYKSCLNILLGIIRTTEVTNAYNNVHDYNGVILIDELDLHLHPEWQVKLVHILRWLVPNAQIIAATHSPHIIQAAKQNEVIPLKFENGEITLNKNVNSSEYGFQGWTVEEVLKDVMGLKDTHSNLYNDLLFQFYKALDNLDVEKAYNSYKEIIKMLHLDNHLKKILKIQMGGLGEEINFD